MPHNRPQTWLLRVIAPAPARVLGRLLPFADMMRAVAEHQAAHPGARYMLHVDTLPAGVDPPEAHRYEREVFPHATEAAAIVAGCFRCPCCNAAPAVARGNGAEDFCDACFASAEGGAEGACTLVHPALLKGGGA